MFSWEELERRI
jgi:hypothetical protein